MGFVLNDHKDLEPIIRRIAREEAIKALQEFDAQFSTEAMPTREDYLMHLSNAENAERVMQLFKEQS